MRKFNQVFKEKQAISEQVLEEKLLNEFKDVYSNLLEQYEILEFHDLDENTQVAFLRELNEYWTEEEGLSAKGVKFLKTKSTLLTEDSTDLQKISYLRNKSISIISETLRQSEIKTKIYEILDEMFKNTKSERIEEVLSADAITGTILESFGVSLQDLLTEMVYELSPESETLNEGELNEKVFSDEKREELAKSGKAMKDGSFPIENKKDLKNAIKAIGRAKNPEAAKTHIKKRAKALGATDLLPEDWK
jgi:hypothetical protein